jgi:uncharacterized damage-inducible protein DinB
MIHLPMLKWVDRTFDFGFPVRTAPLLIERLRGTPARLDDRVRSLPRERLIRRDGAKWSIQEHAGHFVDVEALFAGRLDEYDAGATRLRPADVSGQRTWLADHNRRELSTILAEFRAARGNLVTRLEAMDEAGFARTAIHPRLDRPMRVCDMMLFEAEHDDYHLALITGLMAALARESARSSCRNSE